jgi:hypothetical protein
MVKQFSVLLGFAALLAILAVPLGLRALGQRPDAQAGNAEEKRVAKPSGGSVEGQAASPALPRPTWKAGDSWILVTLTERLQGREKQAAGKAGYIPWKFRVVGIEDVAGRPCYRIDVECLAEGRVRPKSTFWCDQQTLFLRQFQTQMAVGGQYRVVQESYEPGPDGHAPVVTPVNALPVGLPAFLPPGSKRAEKSFRYTSRPLPAGSKSTDVLPFAHEMTQEVRAPSAKSLQQIPKSYSKALDNKPVAEVQLKDYRHTVVQLWQQDTPWPVYTDNGRTQAWLMSDKTSRVEP